MTTRLSPEPMNVSLLGKGDFADGVNLRILRWGDDPGLSGWAQCHHGVLVKGREEVQSQRRRSDDGSRVRSQRMQAPLEAGKRKEVILPWSLQKELNEPR